MDEFACPSPEERLTQPDLRRMEIAAQFREGKGFVFFQHLRKAGGTGFCDLAQRSMPGKTPPYFCMPDSRGTLATPPWNTTWLLDRMAAKGFRIAANEWDAFPRSKFAMAVRGVGFSFLKLAYLYTHQLQCNSHRQFLTPITHPHPPHHNHQNAVFATVMRDPTDRWYSQYRFEHAEHRDRSSTTMPFDEWCVPSMCVVCVMPPSSPPHTHTNSED